jgi:hypothetical protein
MANLKLIDTLCVEQKKKKSDLVEFLNCSPATISNIINRNDCTISLLGQIASFFDVDSSLFLFVPECRDKKGFAKRFNLFIDDLINRKVYNNIYDFCDNLEYLDSDYILISKYRNSKLEIPEKFILYLCRRFKNLSCDWFLNGEGEMYGGNGFSFNKSESYINQLKNKVKDLEAKNEELEKANEALKQALKLKL